MFINHIVKDFDKAQKAIDTATGQVAINKKFQQNSIPESVKHGPIALKPSTLKTKGSFSIQMPSSMSLGTLGSRRTSQPVDRKELKIEGDGTSPKRSDQRLTGTSQQQQRHSSFFVTSPQTP